MEASRVTTAPMRRTGGGGTARKQREKEEGSNVAEGGTGGTSHGAKNPAYTWKDVNSLVLRKQHFEVAEGTRNGRIHPVAKHDPHEQLSRRERQIAVCRDLIAAFLREKGIEALAGLPEGRGGPDPGGKFGDTSARPLPQP